MAVLHIGILTHNALHHTRRCLASLQAHTSGVWRAVVVDNASTDDTPAWLETLDDPRITIERRVDNLGVSGGRNRLFALLRPDMADDDLLVFLDNDMELGAGWDTPFRDAFAAQPWLGIAGKWAFSLLVHDSWRDVLPEEAAVDAPVDTVQGCCFVVRGVTARAVGDFDTALGRFWHEDDDYCIRALHAGWDVRRVASSRMTHHEHGSGLALKPERAAGSLANQAYLARKWRSFDAIDAQGVPRRPLADPAEEPRRQLGDRLGRPAPLLRTELQSALVQLQRTLHAAPNGTPNGTLNDGELAVRATPLVRLLLTETAQGDPSPAVQATAATTLARVHDVLARRRAAAIAAPAVRSPRAFNQVCDPAAWDDPRWFEGVRQMLRDGRGRDWYNRNETAWRDGQLLHVLKAAGTLTRHARVLLVGHTGERLIVALSHLVGALTVADLDPVLPSAIIDAAGQPLGAATLQCASWPLVRSEPDSSLFDVVVCPNSARFAPATAMDGLLRDLATFVSARGVVAIGASVRVAGPESSRWSSATQLFDSAWLASHGLARLGAADTTVADDVLLAATTPDQLPHVRPQLARAVDLHLVSQATLFARRLAA